MKRLFALLLVVAMLLSLCVLPASAADEQSKMSVASFTTYTYDTDTNNVTIGEPKTTPYEKGDLVAVKVTFHNAEEKAIQLTSIQMVMEYDRTAVEPVFWKDPDFGTVYGYAVAASTFGMSLQANEIEAGKVKLGGASAGVKVAAGATVDVAYYLFKVKSEVEAGDAGFALEISELTKKTTSGKESIKDSVLLEGNSVPVAGNPPELASVSIDRPTIEYGSAETLKLTATSTSGKDITSLVNFIVTNATGFTITNGKLSIGNNNVGTYAVHAEPNGNACTLPAAGATYPSATFEIIPATISNPSVTISFGKGVDVPTTATMSDGLTFGTIEWKDESGTKVESGKFAGSSTYTAVITFSADGNHQLAENSTVSVSGVDSQYVTGNQLTGPVDGTYTLTLTLKTADKDTPVVKDLPTASSARWGMTLANVSLTGGSAKFVKADGTEITVPGKFEWMDTTKDVGEPTSETSPYRFFDAKFVPEDTDTYAVLENIRIGVIVNKVLIYINTITNWDYTTAFQYNGEAHKVELVVPENLRSLVNVAYVDNEKTAVGTYTAKATISEADPAHYLIEPSESKERTLSNWEITKGTLSVEHKTVKVRYGTPSKPLTLAELGLSALANEPGVDITFDVSGKGEVISSAGLTRDAEEKITGISLTLQDTDVNSIGKTGSVKLTITSKNYATKELTVTVEIINKDTKTLTVTGPASFPYGTTADTIKKALTVTGLPTGYDASKVTYTFSESDISIATPATGYTVTVGYEDDNFLYTGTYTFEITARSIADADVTFKALTYNGSEQTTEITVKIGEKTLTMGTDYTVTGDLKGTNAGEYTVTVNGIGNYAGTLTPKFTIAKATPTAANFTFTPPANLAYDGNPKAASVTTTNNEIGAVNVSYNPAVPTNAGNYTVSIDVAGSDNYNAATGLTDSAWKFTITPAEITNDMVGSIGALTYTGDALTPALSVADLTAGTDYEVTYANNTNAGSASATVKGKDNYKGAVVRTFTINPANMSFAANMYVSRHTNVRTEQTITLQSITGVKGKMLTPSVTLEAPSSADDIFTVRPAYNAETGNVTFTLNGTAGSATYKVKLASPNSNYAPGEYNLVFTASHRTVIAITFEDGSATYTSKPIRYETASAGESGTWTYTYVPVVGSGASLDTDTRLPLTVGTYNVTAHFENADHIGDKTVTFVINKATPATPPEIKVDNTDTTLGELGNKMLVEIGVPGTIYWYGPDGKPITDPHTKIEANTEYRWTFIPADPDNYNSIEGKTTPYVRDDLSWLPGVLGGGSSFSFHDVTRFDYYYDSVKWAADNGIASGTSRFAFSPDAVCTRAQTVTFLWRAAGSPLPRYRVSPFTDVHSYDYYYEAVLWAVEQGITTGLTATTFGPDETVTRGQVATFLYRAASAAKPNTFNPFTDVKPTAYNYGAILWAYDNRITTGTSTTTFSPDAFCTRAQIVTFLYRYYQGR